MCFSWPTRYFLSQPTFKHWGISNSNLKHTEFPTVRSHTAAQWLLAIYQTQACCLSWSLTLKKCALLSLLRKTWHPAVFRVFFWIRFLGCWGISASFWILLQIFLPTQLPSPELLALFLCACYACEAGGSEVYGQLQQSNESEVSPDCMRPYLKNPKTRAGRCLV